MTEEQIKNWRSVLFNQFGPYALFMPVEQIEKYKNAIQNAVDKLPQKQEEKRKYKK